MPRISLLAPSLNLQGDIEESVYGNSLGGGDMAGVGCGEGAGAIHPHPEPFSHEQAESSV